MSELFCFGLGYTAAAASERFGEAGFTITGTRRTRAGADRIAASGRTGFVFDGASPGQGVADAVERASHVLVSVPPDSDGDLVLRHHGSDLAGADEVRWIAYLSTIGVYGDHAGGWVDEDTPPRPVSARSVRRLEAERQWLVFAERTGKPVTIYRLAGIYGPGRGAIAQLEAGTARRIVKPGQVFNRIHVADIAAALWASTSRWPARAIYNVTDDEPAPPQDVVAYAAGLLGIEPPPEVAFAGAGLSDMGRSFYGENKRVSNRLIKADLVGALLYPTYREGLASLVAQAR